MSNPDGNNIGIKLQDAGENLNTWGNPNLNNALVILSNLASKWKNIVINGDYTVTETNYSLTNDTEVALLNLTPGTVSAAFNLTLPSRSKRLIVRNVSGYAAQAKLTATTGVSIPNNAVVTLATDGASDVYNVSPTHIGTTTQDPASNAVALWGAVQTLVANASLPATGGAILISGTDSTAGYAATKITVSGSLNASIVGAPGTPQTFNINFVFDEGQMALTAGVLGL